MEKRTGNYHVTFAWPEQADEGAFLDVEHLAGEHDCPPEFKIELGIGHDYTGPLTPAELERLTALAQRDRARLGNASYPPSWVVTVTDLSAPAAGG